MSIETKANRVLAYAKEISAEASSWADFSAAMFDQSTGYIAKVIPNELQRQLFLDTPQYDEVNGILLSLMKKFGVVEGATPSKSGKFMVRVPKSLHKVLEIEAKREGVSLNQLALSKLAIPLQNATGLAADLIIEAFNDVHDGYSLDWVIVNPRYNERFVERCRSAGLNQTEAVLNHTLMNIRKASKHKGKLNSATKRSGFADYDQYTFAAEIAVRALQRSDGVTLDRILCDPVYRSQFDELALQMAGDKTELQLRCAALNLRKTRRLQPIGVMSSSYELVSSAPFRAISLDSLSESPGGYGLFDQNRPVFAGETENLRGRIEKHLRYGMPDWLGVSKEDELTLKFTGLPSNRDDRLSWLGGFINKERPLFNYQKAA